GRRHCLRPSIAGWSAMRIELASGTPAERVLPKTLSPDCGLVIAPDIFGLRTLFVELCDRISGDLGWAVCAPEPFPGREELSVEDRMAAIGHLDDRRQVGDLLAGRFFRAVSMCGMIRLPEHWRGFGQQEPLDALES